MSTAWLRVFLDVAHHGSFTSAAQELGYTQSAVSRQVAALEAALGGAPLFDRLPRGVRPTAHGWAFLPHAEAVLDRLAHAGRELAALRDVAGGMLRIGAFPTADAALLPRALAAFASRHPKVGIGRVEGLTADLLAGLDAGEIDLAVVSTTAGDPLDAYALHPLLDEPMYVAAPAGHRLAGRRRVRFAELAGEDWISGHPRIERSLLQPAVRAGHRPRVVHIAAEWIAKQGYVAAGLGLALVPALAAESVRPDIALLALHDPDYPPRRVLAATPRGHSVPPAAHAFLNALEAAAHELRTAVEP
ncbi:LysR family transcriptional regulator [Streptomyces triticagri]|uniref:LysR family transcriptional regulator n=1 Tax=Streptomyces triticagri TaxID=2293568 RepID=A0A372M4L0_9ACTN|nr:LysR family transcriptional regulator [Streptomyces triticagri]